MTFGRKFVRTKIFLFNDVEAYHSTVIAVVYKRVLLHTDVHDFLCC